MQLVFVEAAPPSADSAREAGVKLDAFQKSLQNTQTFASGILLKAPLDEFIEVDFDSG